MVDIDSSQLIRKLLHDNSRQKSPIRRKNRKHSDACKARPIILDAVILKDVPFRSLICSILCSNKSEKCRSREYQKRNGSANCTYISHMSHVFIRKSVHNNFLHFCSVPFRLIWKLARPYWNSLQLPLFSRPAHRSLQKLTRLKSRI